MGKWQTSFVCFSKKLGDQDFRGMWVKIDEREKIFFGGGYLGATL